MELKDFLSKKRPVILKRWLAAVQESYPADAAGFIKEQGHSLANPASYALSAGMSGLFDELLCEAGPGKVASCLNEIIRLRAVQNLTASQAVSFVFLLKKIIKGELAKDIKESRNPTILSVELPHELEKLDSKIDDIALISFDLYMTCREKLYDIKANEMRNWTSRLVERANKIYEKHNSEDAALEVENARSWGTAQNMVDK